MIAFTIEREIYDWFGHGHQHWPHYSWQPMRPRIWAVYERKFKADSHGGERYHRTPPRDERRYAVYARHRQWFLANDGATIDDCQHGRRRHYRRDYRLESLDYCVW